MDGGYKINRNNTWRIIGLCLLLFPFIQQRSYVELPIYIGLFYRYSSIASSLIISVIALKNRRCLSKTGFLPLIYFFCGLYVLLTIISNRKSFFYVAYHSFVYVALVWLITIEIKKHQECLLKALSIIYGLFISLNFILWVRFPNGFYKPGNSIHTGHLLGDDNALV